MNNFYRKLIILFLLIAGSGLLLAQKAEIQYLSGKGCDQTVDWQFFCTEGRNSGK